MDLQEDKEKMEKYEKDDREACKYGTKCYQKNPAHHKKFKHPPKKENEDKEVISKKRKSPEDSESSLSNTSKVKKLETPSSDKDSSSEKIEASKVEENDAKDEDDSSDVTKDESKSSEVDKTDAEDVTENDSTTDKVMSDVMETNTDEKPDDSTTDKVTSDATETNTDEKTGKDETETPNKQETTNTTNDINSLSDTKDNEEKIDEEKNNTEVEDKNVDAAVNKITEKKVDKVEKSTEDKPKEQKIEEKDSKKLNNEEKIPSSAKLNTEAKHSNLKTDVARGDYTEAKRLIQKAFLVPMPNDFYKFYEFCKDVKPVEPSTALKIAELKLVGPYDVLSGLITKEIVENTDLLSHWRYYYDPPEFQTIVKGNDKEGLHFGYWRDRPSSDPVFVATNCSNVSHKIKPVAENIFGAIVYYLEERSKKATPFEKAGFSSLIGKLKSFAKKHNISLEVQSAKMKSREKNVVARTIHGAGIVCPYNKKTQLGYRELSVTDNQLLKIVKKIDDAQSEEERIAARSELGEVVRLATIAGDECDFGTCLELGHDLLSTGCFHVQNAALAVLSIAYNQLDRQAFLKIVESHMKNRKKSSNPSALESVSKE